MGNTACLRFIVLLIFISGCIPSGNVNQLRNTAAEATVGAFKLNVQKAPPDDIQSIQLYKKGSENNPPVIRLNSGQQLVLEFDELAQTAKQFKVEITHRNNDWTRSPLSPNFYLGGFNEFYFGGGLKSFSQRPSFYHYEYEFPNSQLSFEVSGNYLFSVYDYNSDKLLFSLPFFVSENKGVLSTRVTRLFARRNDLRPQDQLFSGYQYPSIVELPQFDLSFFYVQNQFWGRTQRVDIFDTANPGEVNFHIGREESFIANFEFNRLNLTSFNVDGQQVLEFQPGIIPPKILLRRDVESLDPVPRFLPDSRFGLPNDDRNASYAEVQFRLETAKTIAENEEIYLVGDFNQWMISKKNKMVFNPQERLWEGRAFIKQGEYAYKYITLKNQQIDELVLDQGFSLRRQHYLTFVYFKDPARNFDRLLNVELTISN